MYVGLWGTEHKVLRQCCCRSPPIMTPDDKGQKCKKKQQQRVTDGLCIFYPFGQFQSWMYKQKSPQSLNQIIDCCEHMAFIFIYIIFLLQIIALQMTMCINFKLPWSYFEISKHTPPVQLYI